MIIKNNINPFNEELPSEFADRLGLCYSQQVTTKHKKDNGQFFTPIAIANLMASYCDLNKQIVKILDPGCGTAILSCALIERLIENKKDIEIIDLVAYEIDLELTLFSQKALQYLQNWLLKKGIKFKYLLHNLDFVLEKSDSLKEGYSGIHFDLIISNPPYFKLSKDDDKVIFVKEIVSGQTNIYSIFLGIASRLLSENGELIFITPRSFASGKYFKKFRELFFNTLQVNKVHLFNSRKDTFNRDKVLQETVIIKAKKEPINIDKKVLISSSIGIKDISESTLKHFPYSKLINLNSKEKILHLPTNSKEESVLNLVTSWEDTLINYNIQISTGPVVSFRALSHIQNNYENGVIFLAPLFWLQNIDKMILLWPKSLKGKGQFIRIENSSKSLLIPNNNYVLLRRFSTKDDKSRLIAAPYFLDFTKSEFIGVENKVNYIYRKNGHLEQNEVAGLCAVLNSELFDIYFQIFNGNVNVSATELREMRFPPLNTIKEIGGEIILSNDYSMNNVNRIGSNYFRIDQILNIND